jgi:5-methyltetrahydrofolate--homocysteine methyltransferase
MIHVAKEMEKRGFAERGIPLLIGGATTSPAHTAIKIAQHYSAPVVHVLDASRSVPVTTALLSEDQRAPFVAENNAKHEKLRKQYADGPKKPVISLEAARANARQTDWTTVDIATPSFLGKRSFESTSDAPFICGQPGDYEAGFTDGATIPISLRELSNYIDWTPFFHSWELRGVWKMDEQRFQSSNPEVVEQAHKLHADALELMERIITEGRFTVRGEFGFFPANADGDDVIIWNDETRDAERTRFHTLRQQIKKDTGKPNEALSDYVAPVAASRSDYMGAFVVGIHGAEEFARAFDDAHDPYQSIMTKAIADRFAEAFAEMLHFRARVSWGYEKPGDFTSEQLIKENYRGIRPAPGYPAQPDHTEKPILFELLDAERATGVELTESCAMHPGAAVCGLYFSHPESHYFMISELQKDQIEDYARRKGMTVEEVEKWMSPWLGY